MHVQFVIAALAFGDEAAYGHCKHDVEARKST